MNKCKITILDEVNCIISNLQPDHVAYFYEQYGLFAPNHFFSPKFKLGSWDGKLRYFHKTGKTYLYLLTDIVPRLVGLRYEISIDDKRNDHSQLPPPIDENFLGDLGATDDVGEKWVLRDYQVDMINTMISDTNGIGIAGTGAGKTAVTAAMAKAFELSHGYRSLIIVPDKNLTVQTHIEYGRFMLDTGQYSGDVKDLDHQHIVSTWQSLKNNPNLIQEFDMVIVDEAHGTKGAVLSSLLNEYGKDIPIRYGVTGTLPKQETDKLAVHLALGPVRFTIPAAQLIAAGHLATLHIDMVQLNTDLSSQYQTYLQQHSELLTNDKPMTPVKFKTTYFPDYASEKQFCQSNKERMQWIADEIERKRVTGNVLCLVEGVRFGKKLADMVEGAIFLSGANKMEERQRVYELFKDNDNITVVATIKIASTGLNIKRIYNIMTVDVGKSFVRVVQTIGRGLRKAPDKDHVDMTDIYSDLKYGKRHATERCEIYREANYPYSRRTVDYDRSVDV